jgi:hypothetical protein
MDGIYGLQGKNFLPGEADGEAMKAQKETRVTKSIYTAQRKLGRGTSLAWKVQEIKKEKKKNLKKLRKHGRY